MDETKTLKVSDAKFHFARTFLSEYWINGEDFNLENKKSSVFALIKRSYSAVVFSPISSLSCVIVVSASLLILTFILIFDLNIKRLLVEMGGSEDILLYFNTEAQKSGYQELESFLIENLNAKNIKIITKDDALKTFSENLGQHSGILSGLDGNPLPDSMEFKVENLNNKRVDIKEKLEQARAKFSFLEEYVLGAPWADTAEAIRLGVQKLSFIVLALVFGVVAFIVSNVVKLMLYAHREEIEIMQLVGAPRHKVVSPYLISGMILGLVGSALAIGISYLIFVGFIVPLNSVLVFGLSYEMFTYVGLKEICMVFFLGIALGIGGAWFALRKWIE